MVRTFFSERCDHYELHLESKDNDIQTFFKHLPYKLSDFMSSFTIMNIIPTPLLINIFLNAFLKSSMHMA